MRSLRVTKRIFVSIFIRSLAASSGFLVALVSISLLAATMSRFQDGETLTAGRLNSILDHIEQALHLTGPTRITKANSAYDFSNIPATMSDGSDGFLLAPVGTGPSDLRLYIEDDANDSFSIWGNSCGGGGCWDVSKSSQVAQFRADGVVTLNGRVGIGVFPATDRSNIRLHVLAGSEVLFPGAVAGNPNNMYTHFNYGGNGHNYIRGNTIFDSGSVAVSGAVTAGSINSKTLSGTGLTCTTQSKSMDPDPGATIINCPSGYTMTGGGMGTSASYEYEASLPHGNGWYCDNEPGNSRGTCYVRCCMIH